MKKTLIARLVVGALATIAAGGAFAGQIQASSVSIAREAITTDTQSVISPSVAYRFAGDVDARSQAQTFQVQFTLGAGEWSAAPNVQTISITDGVSGVVQAQNVAGDTTVATAGQVAVGIVATYQVTTVAIDPADPKTIYATIVVNQDPAGALIKQPLISINVPNNVLATAVAPAATGAARGTIKKLFTVVGDLLADYASSGACVATKTLPVSFKHFVALTNPAVVATTSNATADEHTRGGATNTATLISFPTNLKVNVTSATGGVTLNPGGNLTWSLKSAGTAFVDANNALLGTVAMAQNAVGYDSDLANQYMLNNAGATSIATAGRATSAVVNGAVEVKDLKVVVSASEGFVTGGTLALNSAANCAAGTRFGTTGTVNITAANAAGPITLTLATADVAAAFDATGANPVYVCYTNPGNVTIPSSAFSAVATLEKSDLGAVDSDEQDNICNGNYISLGGGLKVDLRNYASSKETSGYQSVVRFINNSDSSTADIWAQIIHQDGKLGGWGKLMDLAPRAVMNMTAAEIEAKLTNAATAAVGDTAAAASATGAPRLRITSNSGRSIRVQNYLFNSATGQILEGSNAQGVDFEGTTDRAPASEGQYQIQDANSGLNLQ